MKPPFHLLLPIIIIFTTAAFVVRYIYSPLFPARNESHSRSTSLAGKPVITLYSLKLRAWLNHEKSLECESLNMFQSVVSRGRKESVTKEKAFSWEFQQHMAWLTIFFLVEILIFQLIIESS